MPEEHVRIEIGFDGGQAMTIVVPSTQADELEEKLTEGTDSAYGLEADDGRYVVALKRVVYVKRFVRESRVGFSG